MIFHQDHDLGNAEARELMAVGLATETSIIREDRLHRFSLRHRQDFSISERKRGCKLRDPNGIRGNFLGPALQGLSEIAGADLSMPKVLDVQIRKTTFEPRPLRNFASSLPGGGEAVEFIVKTDAPIPIRALGPALYVGETPVTEVTEIEPNTYRFVVSALRGLERDAAIRLSWTGQPPTEREPSAFQFRL